MFYWQDETIFTFTLILGLAKPWCRHQMETFSTLAALRAGNSPVTSQRPVTRSFHVFFDLRLNKRLSEQSWGGDLGGHHAHCDVTVMTRVNGPGAIMCRSVVLLLATSFYSKLNDVTSYLSICFDKKIIHGHTWSQKLWIGVTPIVRHDDVIKWKHFPRYWSFVRGIHRSSVNSPHKGQWRRALGVSLICVWPTVAQTLETLVIWDVVSLIMTSL